MANNRSSSATEDMLARHQDTQTGLVIGEKTNGAGCGYINGGIPKNLRFSGLKVKAPDCVQLRANGENEVMGVIPDIPLDMKAISSSEFIASLKSVLLDRLSKKNGTAPIDL